jgi:hypothetical protein
MRSLTFILISLTGSGCVTLDRDFARSVPADGATVIVGTVERGSLTYRGTGEDTFEVTGTTVGTGSSHKAACRKRKGNDWTLAVQDGVFHVQETSEYKQARVDFDIAGPPALDTDIELLRGDIDLESLVGDHLVTADYITARRLEGSVDFLSRSRGMDVDVWPDEGGSVYLESTAGSVVLRLPYGGNYDIEVIADPDYDMVVADLGFNTDYSELGYFTGVSGDGSVRVMVYVNGGSFELLESW